MFPIDKLFVFLKIYLQVRGSATTGNTVMVHARSRSFQKQSKDGSDGVSDDGHLTIVQCHPYHQPTLSDLYRTPVGIHPLLRYHQQTNHHSYYCHYQPAPCAIYHSTTRAPPHSTHIPCCRPIILCMHQFSRPWVSVTTRTCEDLSQHLLASFGVRVFL